MFRLQWLTYVQKIHSAASSQVQRSKHQSYLKTNDIFLAAKKNHAIRGGKNVQKTNNRINKCM